MKAGAKVNKIDRAQAQLRKKRLHKLINSNGKEDVTLYSHKYKKKLEIMICQLIGKPGKMDKFLDVSNLLILRHNRKPEWINDQN